MKKLTNVQEAIEQAIEGGYGGPMYQTMDGYGHFTPIPESEVLISASFWQSLNKARGWQDEVSFIRWSCRYDGCNDGTETLDDFKEKLPEIYDEVVISKKSVEHDGNYYCIVEPSPEWKKYANQ